MNKLNGAMVAVVAGAVWVSGCGPGGGGNDAGLQAVDGGCAAGLYPVVAVDASPTGPQTWKANTTYVLSTTIRFSSPLTIEACAVVKFKSSASLETEAGGTITAVGTEARPIVFTSVLDDSVGGDSGGDGPTAPAAKDWDVVWLGSDGSTFDHCVFRYGGSYHGSTLDLGPTKTTVKNSVFAHSAGGTLDRPYGALMAGSAKEATVVTGNVFFDNDVPMVLNANLSLDDSNVFHDPAHPATINRYNGIFEGDGELNGAVRWEVTEVPLVLNQVDLNAGGTLTLGPGVTLKFKSSGNIAGRGGVVKASGTSQAPVTFTSLHDDAVAGDTDGNGTATPAAPKDWDAVYLGANGSSFDHCAFRYSGSYWGMALDLGSNVATVTNSVFSHDFGGTLTSAYGALAAYNAKPGTIITGNTFFANEVPLVVGSSFSLSGNAFHDPAHPSSTNHYNAVFIDPGHSTVAGTVSWGETEVPFLAAQLWVPAGTSLTLASGVVVKFLPNGKADVATGATFSSSGATLTSVKDDAHGGDTGGDGPTTGAAGDWQGVAVNNVWVSASNILYAAH